MIGSVGLRVISNSSRVFAIYPHFADSIATMSFTSSSSQESSVPQIPIQFVKPWADPSTGEFKRQPSMFRNFISTEPGAKFTPESNRYHLYISHACPWAHRTMLVRSLKGLEDVISVNVVDFLMEEGGWKFSSPEECPGATLDTINHAQFIREIYFKVDPSYGGFEFN